MSIAVAPNSEAHLTNRDGVIRRSATYEIHLSGDSLQRLANMKHPEGAPGALWEAIQQYLNGGQCHEGNHNCLTPGELQALNDYRSR